MSTSQAELLRSIDTIYDTVLDPERWPEALDRTASAAGAFGAMLMVSDEVIHDLQIHTASTRIGSAEVRTYVRSQLSSDELRWDEALAEVPALTVLHDTEIWPDRGAYDAMESVKWLRSWKFYHRSAVRLCAHGGWRDSVATVYPDDRGGMTRAEERQLAPLLPHLARAVEIRRPFALLRKRYQAVLTMLDHLGIGVVVLVADDHVLLSNSEAERVLDAGDALRRRPDGRLALPSERSEGGASLRRALADVRSGLRPDGATVYVARGSERPPYVVDVVEFREGGDELGTPVTGVMLCVVDPERRSVISTRGLAQVYGLTDAESAVCALMGEGHSTQEIADLRSVSIDTVKAQSKAIFRKTLCGNRVELVRRALSIAPPLLGPGGGRDDG